MFFAAVVSPVIETITIIAVLATLMFLIALFLKKTKIGNTIVTKTPWMGWSFTTEDDYTNFTIHPSNYYHGPSNR